MFEWLMELLSTGELLSLFIFFFLGAIVVAVKVTRQYTKMMVKMETNYDNLAALTKKITRDYEQNKKEHKELWTELTHLKDKIEQIRVDIGVCKGSWTK